MVKVNSVWPVIATGERFIVEADRYVLTRGWELQLAVLVGRLLLVDLEPGLAGARLGRVGCGGGGGHHDVDVLFALVSTGFTCARKGEDLRLGGR